MFPRDWSHCGGLEVTNDSKGFSFRDLTSSGRKGFRSIHSKVTTSKGKDGASITDVHLSSCDLARRRKHFLLFFFFSWMYLRIIAGVPLPESECFEKGGTTKRVMRQTIGLSNELFYSGNRLSGNETLKLLRISRFSLPNRLFTAHLLLIIQIR